MVSNIFAGLLAGVVTLTYSLSYAVFIFSGALSKHLHVGLRSALISACVVALVVSLGSSFRFAIAGPDSNASALLALMTSSIVAQLPVGTTSSSLLSTVWVSIALCSVLTGVVLFVLGRMKMGRLIRFIPYPVVGGFLAATGWLIFQGSFKVMSGHTLSFEQIDYMVDPPVVWHCLSGFGLALLLLFVLRRWRHFLVLPVLLLSAVGLFYGVIFGMDIPLSTVRQQGWLFADIPSASLNPWEVLKPGETHWWLLLDQMTNCLAMIAVVAMTILLNASGLELATMTDAKLDRELEAAGAANVAAGAFGGMVGYLSISRSLLNFEAGGKSRLSGLVAAGCCAALLVWGPSALLYIPKPVLGGLLCYLGLALLVEWLVDARHRLSRFDYFLVVTILLFVSIWDFLTAVGLGTVIACLLFAFNYSRVRVVKHAMSCKEHRSKVVRSLREQELLEQEGERIGIFCLQGFIFFGTVSNLLTDITERLTNKERPHLDYLLLDFRLVLGVDSSATLSFLKLKRLANSHHFMLIFTGVNETTKAKLVQAGCINEEERWCRLFPDLDRGLEFCENLLLVELTGMTSQSVSLHRQLTQVFDNPERLPRLLAYMEKVSLPKGFVLFHQGDEADALYFVESGKLTVTLHLPRNRTKRLATIGPGAIVGEIGLFLNRPRSASVITEQSVVLYKMTHASFLELQVKEPELALAFQQAVIGLLSRRLMQANKELDILLK